MRVEREIVIPAEPKEVWSALTEAKRLEEWFANGVELDAVGGGSGRFRWDDGEERQAVVVEASRNGGSPRLGREPSRDPLPGRRWRSI
ncbi:MAG: SRPBCC domain-containing protein [Gaiellaceae bacterium MAG52_C11]|nr:SRPBCC domain-containing protein [Candidatus Gaiellasilicea maunaloa]